MWKRLVLPTVVMAVMWVVVSGSTTLYLYWLTRSYQRVFAENVQEIYSLEKIQDVAWRSLTTASQQSSGSVTAQLFEETSAIFDRESASLSHSASTGQLAELRAELNQNLDRFKQALHALSASTSPSLAEQRRGELALLTTATKEIARITDKLCDINRELASQTNLSRDESTATVLMIRLSIMVLGPGMGIIYGWWMARRLQSSVARITVMLQGAPPGERTLGDVKIENKQDLDAIQSQVELVVSQLHRANNDLKQARDELLRSERLAAVGELAAGVAHEIRNPLTAVKLLLQYSALHRSTENLTEEKLNLILDEIARMESTIQGLLDFSRPPRLNRVRHDLRDSMRRAMNLVVGRAQQQNIRMHAQWADVPLTVDADPEQLHQVFVNLLLNSVEAMPDGGDLTVQAERREGTDEIEIRVQDTGHGIPEDILKRLFEPFVTGKDRGTGLGLAISRRIVADHRGTITAWNRDARGAEFQIILPAS